MSRRQNFDQGREVAEQLGNEWKFGAASQPGVVSVPESKREQYLPKGETQFGAEDFQDCASRSPVNKLENDFTYGYQNNFFTKPNAKWLLDNGYVGTDGHITFSDRYIAVLSGTTRQGNSLKAPLEAIRKNGLIPKSLLPKQDGMTFDQYHDPSKITPAMKALGAEFLRRFSINYEQVSRSNFDRALAGDMIGVAGYAWPQPIDGVYPNTSGDFNHAFLIFRHPMSVIFDNYEEAAGDYIKQLAPDYLFYDYGYRVYISNDNPDPDTQVSVFNALSLAGLVSMFMDWLSRFKTSQSSPVKRDETPQDAPKPPTPTPPTSPTPKYRWETKEKVRNSIRLICDEEGLTLEQKDTMTATIEAESGFNTKAVNYNKVDGKVVSVDYGLCQWNDYYHRIEISPADALNDPQQAVRLMCAYWKRGQRTQWIAYKSGAYRKYLRSS